MKKIILMTFALLSGWGGLQASVKENVSIHNECNMLSDTTERKTVTVRIESMEDLQNAFKSLLGGGGGQGVRMNMTRMVETPPIKENSNQALSIQSMTLSDSATLVVLDVQKCKGKLTGIDTSAYLQVNGKQYSIQKIKDGKLPTKANETLKFDAKNKTLELLFPGVPSSLTITELDLILSKDPKGIQMKGVSLQKKVSATTQQKK